MSIKLECANCWLKMEFPENISLQILNEEAQKFFKKHSTRIGNQWCNKSNLFISTYTMEKKMETIYKKIEDMKKYQYVYKMTKLPLGKDVVVGETEWHCGYNQALDDVKNLIQGLNLDKYEESKTTN